MNLTATTMVRTIAKQVVYLLTKQLPPTSGYLDLQAGLRVMVDEELGIPRGVAESQLEERVLVLLQNVSLSTTFNKIKESECDAVILGKHV